MKNNEIIFYTFSQNFIKYSIVPAFCIGNERKIIDNLRSTDSDFDSEKEEFELGFGDILLGVFTFLPVVLSVRNMLDKGKRLVTDTAQNP